MVTAKWSGVTLAETDQPIVIEGNYYFPPDSIKKEYFKPSESHTTCPWKGEASYYNIEVEGQVNKDAASYYPEPKEGSIPNVGHDFTNYVAFWHGVEVVDA